MYVYDSTSYIYKPISCLYFIQKVKLSKSMYVITHTYIGSQTTHLYTQTHTQIFSSAVSLDSSQIKTGPNVLTNLRKAFLLIPTSLPKATNHFFPFITCIKFILQQFYVCVKCILITFNSSFPYFPDTLVNVPSS